VEYFVSIMTFLIRLKLWANIAVKVHNSGLISLYNDIPRALFVVWNGNYACNVSEAGSLPLSVLPERAHCAGNILMSLCQCMAILLLG